MIRIKEDDFKKIGVKMLDYIDKICRKHDINYYIIGGTLIGAVRHHGYIPWDDDIDICMFRDDYNRFREIMLKQDDYRYISMEVDDDYYFTFARVCDKNSILKLKGMREIHNLGVYIDVFPLDNTPDNNQIEQWYEEGWNLRHKIGLIVPSSAKYQEHSLHTLLRIVRCMPSRIKIGTKCFSDFRSKLNNHIQKFNTISTEKCIVFETPYGLKFMFNKLFFESSIDLDFEGIKVKAPIGYDEILTQVYGDYMVLPPIEKRVSHHHFTAYWIE